MRFGGFIPSGGPFVYPLAGKVTQNQQAGVNLNECGFGQAN